MKLVYPAIFYKEEDGIFSVDIPDLLGCVTCGDNLADAFYMANDAASGWLFGELEDGNKLPVPSAIDQIEPDPEIGQVAFINYIYIDLDDYASKYGTKSVKKNCTLPAWMNTYGEKKNLNYSKILQNAIEEMYKKEMEWKDEE